MKTLHPAYRVADLTASLTFYGALGYAHLGTVEVDCLTMFSADGRPRLAWFPPIRGTQAVELLSVLGAEHFIS